MLASTRIEGKDGGDGFGLEKLGEPMRIQATVIDGGADGDRHGMCGTGLEEAIQTGRPQREVGHLAWGNVDVYGQGMRGGDHAVLKGAMAKAGRVPGGVIAPRSGRIAGEPVMVTAKDAVGATGAGGPPVGTGACGEGGPIAAQDQRLEVAQEPTVG